MLSLVTFMEVLIRQRVHAVYSQSEMISPRTRHMDSYYHDVSGNNNNLCECCDGMFCKLRKRIEGTGRSINSFLSWNHSVDQIIWNTVLLKQIETGPDVVTCSRSVVWLSKGELIAGGLKSVRHSLSGQISLMDAILWIAVICVTNIITGKGFPR